MGVIGYPSEFQPVPISDACASVPACNLVSNGWNSMTAFGNNAYGYTITYLNALTDAIDPAELEIPTSELTVEFPAATLGQPTIGPAPSAPDDLDLNLPDAPVAPTLSAISQIEIPTTPEFLAAYPTITIPAAPTPITDQAPSDVPTFTSPTIPDAPVTTIPEAPTLRSLNIPDAPAIDLPGFSAIEPDEPGSIFEPTITFSESLYDSTLLQQVQTSLLNTLQNGDGGLPEDIIDQIWERERERELKEYNRQSGTALNEFAARGFELPPGALATRLKQAERESVEKSITMGRDKTIEQVQRAYEHLKFVIQNSISLEGQLMNYTNNMYQRLLQVQTALVDAGVQVYNSKVNAYNAKVQAYRVYADVFKTQIEAELAKIEVFRAQIEGQQAIAALNTQDLEAYKTSIEAVETIASVYRTEMEAARVEADVQRVAIDAFRAQVDAFTARVNAKASEYEGYAQQINGELAKVRLYESSANAYSSEVNGYRALVDAESTRVRADVDLNRARVEEFQGQVSAFRALVEAEGSRVGTQVQAFGAEIDAYRASVTGEVSRSEAERAILETKVRTASAQADLRLKEADINITRAKDLLTLYQEALQAGATASAQLTASALDAINLGASIAGQDSTTTSL